ncbi:MAG: hypothetical protein OEO82_02090 [Gammaproteobacteria bacterium]|nr:hypothetical protein [Gammaproteobacteria bacterium]
MKDLQQDEQFAERAKQLFDGSVERLDAATLSRLNHGRQKALEELRGAAPHGQWLRWIPVTGVAAAVLVTVMVMRGPNGVDVPLQPATATDLEILLDEDSLEMLEDLEFYSWLEASDLDTNGNVG